MPAPQKGQRLLDSAFLASLETLDVYLRSALRSRLAGSRRSQAFGGAADFADHREYQPGDDIRRIDWNLAGRTGQLFIKRFLDERKQNLRIYIDTSASMLGAPDTGKALAALRVAAALAYLAVGAMDQVTFLLLEGENCCPLCGTVNGRASLFSALEQLEKIAFFGNCDLLAAVTSDPAPGLGDGLSVIVSDFLTDSDWQGAVDFLLSRGRETALARVLAPGEESPAYRGPQALLDAEDKTLPPLRLEADREALKAYTQAVDWFSSEMERFCASRQTPLLCLRSDEPVDKALIQRGFSVGLIR